MSWATPASTSPDQRQVGLVLLIENADLIRTVAEVGFWYEQGVRVIEPAWHTNRYTASTNDSGPLTELGRQLLAEMQRFGMILDLSHMADEACLEALERFNLLAGVENEVVGQLGLDTFPHHPRRRHVGCDYAWFRPPRILAFQA